MQAESFTIDKQKCNNLYYFQNITSEQMFLPRVKGVLRMKEKYIEQIIDSLYQCEDLPLLDLILKLLEKSS